MIFDCPFYLFLCFRNLTVLLLIVTVYYIYSLSCIFNLDGLLFSMTLYFGFSIKTFAG